MRIQPQLALADSGFVAPLSTLQCRAFGHRFRFADDGATMRWTCQRCRAVGGVKRYASAAETRAYAAAFDREDRDDLGRRAPLTAGLPLRLLRLAHRRRTRA